MGPGIGMRPTPELQFPHELAVNNAEFWVELVEHLVLQLNYEVDSVAPKVASRQPRSNADCPCDVLITRHAGLLTANRIENKLKQPTA